MPNYKEGLNRNQQLLFPPSLDEYVDKDNPVRAIESYVDSINLADLGVFTSSGGSDGQPAYHPALLLKIYTPRAGFALYMAILTVSEALESLNARLNAMLR
jgi:transposase